MASLQLADILDAVPSLKESAAERRVRRIDAFPASITRNIAALTDGSPALEDLADSFPALLFALASGYGSDLQRERARSLVDKGMPLRDAAAALGLPWWLRRMPPDSFSAPLRAVPDGPEFAVQIADLIPERGAAARLWLERVLNASAGCGPALALWIARHYRTSTIRSDDPTLNYLAAWAWYSGQPGTTGHAILRRPWTPDIGLRRALDEVTVWRRRAALAICLGDGLVGDWVVDGAAHGYAFVTLRTIDDFLNESAAMTNCLDQFADHMETGSVRVVSIRKNGRSVADIEIGTRDRQSGVPEIVQLRAPRNRRAPPEVWQAAYAWLGSQQLDLIEADEQLPAKRRANRRAFWLPYLESRAASERQRIEPLLIGDRRISSTWLPGIARQGILTHLAARITQRR